LSRRSFSKAGSTVNINIYACADGRQFGYRTAGGEKIGSFKAFMMGLPTKWSWYAYVAVLVMIPLALFGPVLSRLGVCLPSLRRQEYGRILASVSIPK
jgi:hypothetical protein